MKITRTVLADISATLADHGIAHAPLHDRSRRGCLNTHVGDGASVFVKVSTQAGAGAHLEPAACDWAHARRLSPVKPLAPTMLHTRRGLVITAFEHLDVAEPLALRKQAVHMTRLLARLHSQGPNPDFENFDAAPLLDLVHSRLDGIHTWAADVVRSAVADAAAIFAEHADPSRFVACHGDAHLGNMVRTGTGRHYLVDWESARNAPAEYDIAQLARTILTQQPEATTAQRAVAARLVLDAASDMNRSLLDATMRIRSCLWAAYLMRHGVPMHDYELAMNFLIAQIGIGCLERTDGAPNPSTGQGAGQGAGLLASRA